jgi:isocitrate lyase
MFLYDKFELCHRADDKIRTFKKIVLREADISIIHTLPTYHTTRASYEWLQGYFRREGMLAYVKGVQRQEIRKG